MKKKNLAGITAGAILTAICSVSAFAMPADIEEAVTQEGYNPYEHDNSSANYDEADLIAIGEDYVATANAMIRESPFGQILGSVTPGETYYVVGECPDCMWYKISGNTSGYVYASYMVPESDYTAPAASAEKVLNVRTLDMKMLVAGASSVNVRTEPSRYGSIVTALKEGTEVHVTGNVLDTEWYECSYEGETVYICDDYLNPELPQTMACTAAKLNIRDSAGMDGKIIGVLKKGDKVRVSADENDWLRFSMEDGTIGYVYDEYMAVVG